MLVTERECWRIVRRVVILILSRKGKVRMGGRP